MIHRVGGNKQKPYEALAMPARPLELDACYSYCEAMARARHHNFPVASLFVPTSLRRHIFPIYAFARVADDVVTEREYDGRRARELDSWERRLEGCFHGEPADHPVFVALADTIARFELPITPFVALLSGCRSDLDQHRYDTSKDLENYCHNAAAPIGNLLLYMGGYREPALHRYADDLAIGVAFASFWQDIRSDLDAGRIHVPHEDLRHFDLTEEDLLARRAKPAIGALVRYEVARTRALFERARPLVDLIGHDMAIEVALIWHGGMRILDKIDRIGEHILTRRPRLNKADKAFVVTRALAWRGGSLTRRGETLQRWISGDS